MNIEIILIFWEMVCPLTYLYGIQCSTTFILSVFSYNSYFWLILSVFSFNLYFWQCQAPNWIYFSISIQCNISIFGAPCSTPGGNRCTLPLTFMFRIQCWATFGSSVLSYNLYFWQHQASNWIYFSISVQCKISIFGAPCSTPGGNRWTRPLTFMFRIQCWATFSSSVLSYNLYFWQHQASNWIYFSILVQCKISIFGAP